jgi:hypothetical protein
MNPCLHHSSQFHNNSRLINPRLTNKCMHGRLVVIKLKFFHMVDVSFSLIFLLTVHFVSHHHAVTRTGGTRKEDPHDQNING